MSDLFGDDLFGDEEDLIGDLFGDDDDDDDFTGDDDLDALLAGDDDDDSVIGAAPNAAKLAKLAKLGMLPAGVKKVLAAAAKKQAAKNVAAKRAKALMAMRRKRAIGVVQRRDSYAGEIPMGFEESIDAGASETITITPQVKFKPKRLLVPSSIASSFRLDDLSTGLRNLLMSTNPVPLESYTETSVNQGWRLPTIQVGQSLVMRVTNTSGATATLKGAWHGIYAD